MWPLYTNAITRIPDQVVDDPTRSAGTSATAAAVPGRPGPGRRARTRCRCSSPRPSPPPKGVPGVEEQEDPDRVDRPADPGRQRQRDLAAPAQLAHVELAARLQAHDQELSSARSSPSPASYRPVATGRTGSPAPCATSPHTRPGRRWPTPAPRAWRRAEPPRRQSRCAGTGAAASAGSASTRCAATNRHVETLGPVIEEFSRTPLHPAIGARPPRQLRASASRVTSMCSGAVFDPVAGPQHDAQSLPACPGAVIAATRTGLSPAGDDELTNSKIPLLRHSVTSRSAGRTRARG